MTLSEQAYAAGQEVAAATGSSLVATLNAAVGRFLGWPYNIAPGCIADADGRKTESFASVIYVERDGAAPPDPSRPSPADNAAAVIDVHECLDLEGLRAAYARIADAKNLRKSPAPQVAGTPSTTITLGIIYAHSLALPLEAFAAELERLNAQTPSRQWPDMLAVGSVGAISYAAHFPGDAEMGDYLPPAEGALASFTPPMYIVMVMTPAVAYTFNKMAALVIAHLVIFSPGAKLPNWSQMKEGIVKNSIVFTGYQYNLKGDLLPVPREFYNDRYFPPPPLRIESQAGELLSTIQFLPWQDGGTILLKGKLPLEGLLVFIGNKAFDRGGIVRPRPDVQMSYVVPITREDFNELIRRIQRQTNMVVKSGECKWIVQKLADEGTSTPFFARIFMGVLRLRDLVYYETARDKFDQHFEFVGSSLLNARSTAKELAELWEEHVRKLASGEAVRIQGRTIRIDENIDKQLRRLLEGFLNSAVRTLKQGMQDLAVELQVNIGFMYKQQGAFDTGIAALQASEPLLAEYLRHTRAWSERLIESRNAIEHKGWTLPRIAYAQTGNTVAATEPMVSGQPVTEFVKLMLDRLCCFVEEFTAHGLQRRMPPQITITELPLATRPAEAPERFRVTFTAGGLPAWRLAYHAASFENT